MRSARVFSRVAAVGPAFSLMTLVVMLPCAAGGDLRHRRSCQPISCTGSRLPKNPYRDIRMDIFDNYVPALPSALEPLVVTINLQLVALIGVNEPEETTVINAWMIVYWKDEALSWKPEHYANITVAEFPTTSRLWVPDIAWYERIPMVEAYEYDEGLFNGARAVISSNGELYVSRGLLMRSHCKLQVKRFPFDTQQCNFTFQSTVHNINRVILRPHANRVWRPESTEGWIVLGFPAYNANKTYPEVGSFSRVIFSLKIKRKPLFYIFYLMVPNFLISVLGCFVFLLPPESSEKVTFCVSILLSLTIFMMIMLGLTPPSESVPLLSQYFFLVLLTCMGNAAITIIIQCLYDRQDDAGKLQNGKKFQLNKPHCAKEIIMQDEAVPLSPAFQPAPIGSIAISNSSNSTGKAFVSRKISLKTVNRVSRICFVASLTFSLVVPSVFFLYGKYGGDA